MARISSFGNPFYRTSFINGRIFRSTGQSYATNLLSNLSTKNPSLTRKVFSNYINTKNNSTSENVKKSLEEYDKKITDNKNVGKVLANYLNYSSPLYTGNSSLTPDYSALGGLINYIL